MKKKSKKKDNWNKLVEFFTCDHCGRGALFPVPTADGGKVDVECAGKLEARYLLAANGD